MNSRDTKIQNILKDYSKQQQELEKELLECRSSRYETQRIISEKVSRDKSDSKNFKVTPEAARNRNRQLLQDLESVKARLRTIASFTPTDQELVDAARRCASCVAEFLQVLKLTRQHDNSSRTNKLTNAKFVDRLDRRIRLQSP